MLQNCCTGGAGHTECVRVLLAAGSLVDGVTTSGSTALHSAASNGHDEVVQHLVAAGADVDVQVCHSAHPDPTIPYHPSTMLP